MVKEEVKEEKLDLERANLVAERLENASREMNAVLEKQQSIQNREILGGSTFAGKPEEPKKETPREYAKRILGGHA